MRLSVQLNLAGSFADIVAVARSAEDLGYAELTSGQVSGRDTVTALAALATRTSRIGLSTSVLPIYARSPASMAQAAATLDDVSGGRFTLGLGVGHRVTMGDWHGQEIGRPVSEMREYTAIVRTVLRGEQAPVGERWRSSMTITGFTPRPSLRIHVAGLSPAMLRLAGEIADGVVLWTTPPAYIRDVVVPHVAEGRRRRGLSMDGFEVVPVVSTAHDPRGDVAVAGIRTQLHRYFGLPFYRAMFAAAGYRSELDAYDAAAPDVERQKAAISDAFISTLCIVGDDDALAGGLERYSEVGATALILSNPPGADQAGTLSRVTALLSA